LVSDAVLLEPLVQLIDRFRERYLCVAEERVGVLPIKRVDGLEQQFNYIENLLVILRFQEEPLDLFYARAGSGQAKRAVFTAQGFPNSLVYVMCAGVIVSVTDRVHKYVDDLNTKCPGYVVVLVNIRAFATELLLPFREELGNRHARD
jgi:hypothetical protein